MSRLHRHNAATVEVAEGCWLHRFAERIKVLEPGPFGQ
jgi:hypothetical protein